MGKCLMSRPLAAFEGEQHEGSVCVCVCVYDSLVGQSLPSCSVLGGRGERKEAGKGSVNGTQEESCFDGAYFCLARRDCGSNHENGFYKRRITVA